MQSPRAEVALVWVSLRADISDLMSEPHSSGASTPFTLDIEFSVVSGSREDLLIGCIESVYEVMRPTAYSWTLTVTCNSPGDGLAQRLNERFTGIRTIENQSSRGFAANHNVVIAASTARYVWLLNDDLVLLPECVERITEYMDAPENARVAVVSPRLVNPDGSLQPSTYSFPTMPQTMLAYSGIRERPFTNRMVRLAAPILRSRRGASRFWAHDETIVVDTLRGACVAVRMAAVRDVGHMVEVAIVGGEETEWHRRFHDRGWKVVFFADASVIHYGSQTVSGSERDFYPEYLRGALYYFRIHRAPAVFAVFCASLLTMYGLRVTAARITRNKAAAEGAGRYLAVVREAMRWPRALRPA